MFEFDPGEDIRLIHLLGRAIMTYLSTPLIYEGLNFDNRGEDLSSFYDELVSTMNYTTQRFPNSFLN